MDVCVGVVFKGKDGLVAIIFKNTGCVLEVHQQHYLFIYLLSHLDFWKVNCWIIVSFCFLLWHLVVWLKRLVIFSSAINSFPDSYIFTLVILFLLDCKCLGWIYSFLCELLLYISFGLVDEIHTSNYIVVLWISTDQAVNLPCGRELLSRNKIIWIKSFQVQELFHSRTKLGSLMPSVNIQTLFI